MKRERDLIEERAGELLAGNTVTERTASTLVFRKPDTSDCRMRYDLIGTNRLVVTGDLGDAVYQWHGNPVLSWWWLGELDLSYFLSKCRASEVGVPFVEWSSNEARRRWAELKASIDPDERRKAEAILADQWGEDELFEDRAAWNSFAGRELVEVWTDLDGVLDIGIVPNLRGVCHWLGLRLAQREHVAGGGR